MSLQKDSDRSEIKHLRKFVDFTASRKRVLEIGCGEGRLTWQYAKDARSVVAVDLDHDSLRVAKVDRPSSLDDTVYLACANSEYLPFSKEKFDIAILAWSL
jgi:ubiquinone/menaquinone biosynthesis C-methylase UbiE